MATTNIGIQVSVESFQVGLIGSIQQRLLGYIILCLTLRNYHIDSTIIFSYKMLKGFTLSSYPSNTFHIFGKVSPSHVF